MGTTIGVIGTGNMGAALVRGWLRSPGADTHFVIYDVLAERTAVLAEDPRVTVAASAADVVRAAKVVLFVVKPKDIDGVLRSLSPDFDREKIIISSAAGVTTQSLSSAAGEGPAVFRIMPNLGVELGEGVVAVAPAADTAPEVVDFVMGLLAPLGLVEHLSEDVFDAVTAVSGSSIGFLALVMEGMEDGAVRAGLPRPTARAFIRQTALAASLLLREYRGSAADIKDQVSSPAGTTIAGLAVLEDAAVRGAFIRAIEEATERGRALRDVGRPRVIQ